MPRRMSCALTLEAVEQRRKTVTRRLGWLNAKPGDRLLLVDRVMGFKKGERARVLAEVRIVDARRERVDAITWADCVREGFPDLTPEAFVAMFCKAMRCTPDTIITRIEWRFETMTAAEFIASINDPIVRFASVGRPAGDDVAYFDDNPPELGFDLSELEGTVRADGVWEWDGDGDPRDPQRNTVTAIWIRDEAAEWQRQREDWEASV